MSKNINEITKEKILSIVDTLDPFNNDKYIELKKEINILLKMNPYIKNIDMKYIDILLQKHTKKIYPRNILNIFPNNSYDNYQKNFFSYLDTQKDKLDDLWMVIGATNSDTDLERFQNDYDITIDSIDSIDSIDTNNLNIHETKLITLGNNYIYNKLIHYKFSKIIYDWSVTKFIRWDIFKDLKNIEKLISLYGILYIDKIPKSIFQSVYNLNKNKINPDLYCIDIDIVSNFYDRKWDNFVVKLDSKPIYNSYKLFDIMDPNGCITKIKLDEHIKNNIKDDYLFDTFYNQNLDYVNIVIQKLKKIFTEEKFIINYHKNSKTYPNNPLLGTEHAEIKYYYEIIRIAL